MHARVGDVAGGVAIVVSDTAAPGIATFIGPLLEASAEAAVMATLLPSMAIAEVLATDQPVDEQFHRSSRRGADAFRVWYPEVLTEQPRRGPTDRVPDGPRGRGTACFFTGGVDSFYSVLKNGADIDALIFVQGFDVRLTEVALNQQVGTALRRAAEELGKDFVEITTNLRAWSDPVISYARHYHGTALATIAHLVKHRYGRVIIPATHTYDHLVPWGSSPLTDPLWGGADLEIVHDGAEATRVEKMRLIAGSSVALRTLRVCPKSKVYNCGRCEKCLRTMATLRVMGALPEAAEFPDELDLHRLRAMRLPSAGTRRFAIETQAAASGCGDHELARALTWQIRLSYVCSATAGVTGGLTRIGREVRSWAP